MSSHQNHQDTSSRKHRDGTSIRKPDVTHADLKHSNPVSQDPTLAPPVTGGTPGSHDSAFG